MTIRTDTAGFVTIGAARFGTVRAWAGLLQRNPGSIRKRLSTHAHHVALDPRGKETRVYDEAEVASLYHEDLEKLPLAAEDGKVAAGGKTYRTFDGWVRELGIPPKLLVPMLTSAHVNGRRGLSRSGAIVRVYSQESVSRAVAADALARLRSLCGRVQVLLETCTDLEPTWVSYGLTPFEMTDEEHCAVVAADQLLSSDGALEALDLHVTSALLEGIVARLEPHARALEELLRLRSDVAASAAAFRAGATKHGIRPLSADAAILQAVQP